jgi:hypothetical protein
LNIEKLKALVASMPNEIVDLGPIEAEIAALLDEQRKADLAELAATEARLNALRAKLNIQRSQNIAHASEATRPRSELDETDAGNGVREPREENHSAQSFVDELASLRERTQMKRRRLG